MSHLTDHILYNIQYSDDPNLKAAKTLLDRIHTRRLYKLIRSYNLILVSKKVFNIKYRLIFSCNNQLKCAKNIKVWI